MAEKKKGKRAPRSLNVKVVESGRVRTAQGANGIDWELMSDGSYRYWLRFASGSGAVLRMQAWPTKAGLKPEDL